MEMHVVLVTFGLLFLAGLVADEVGRRTRAPRVTLLLALGVIVGQSGFDLLPPAVTDWYEFLSAAALSMIAFLLGGSLSVANLRRHGRAILTISATIVLTTIAIVTGGLVVLGVDLAIALLLAGIATATDPVATRDVIRQTGSRGDFADTLSGIVAVDDAWGLIAFSVVLVVASLLMGNGADGLLARGLWEIGSALVLGLAIGFPAAFLTGRIRPHEPLQAEALGIVFLTAGLSAWIGASFLLAGMTAGAVVVNFARHHRRAFHEIENIEWPFMILFFVLAGASLDISLLWGIGALGGAYIALRVLARLVGGWLGGAIGRTPHLHRRWMGMALLPQAGVAIGMALVAAHHFPENGDLILTLAIGTTVVFELFGPVMAYVALKKVGVN
ncbi:MAG: cation:proton antiporter [Alphaproteobacteria bacterium]|jgi:Kef-type K+ transport system membrane component KefB|nr:cation:proton antiporter [Alphaproteobacteria bacterium]